MRFEISRARNRNSAPDEPPCSGALRAGTRVYGEEWGCPRTVQDWEVELDSIEGLMALVAEVGSIIIEKPASITVYDDYVE